MYKVAFIKKLIARKASTAQIAWWNPAQIRFLFMILWVISLYYFNVQIMGLVLIKSAFVIRDGLDKTVAGTIEQVAQPMEI